MFQRDLGNGIELRLFEVTDAEALFALTDRNRARLREWLPWLDANTLPEHSRGFIEFVRKGFENKQGFACGIFERGELRGVVGYHAFNWSSRSVTMGYWLGEEAQGKGLISLAMRAMIDHAFVNLGIHRIELRCATGNTRSQRVAERLGFAREGTLRECEWLYDHFVDHHFYGLLRSDARS